VIKETRKIKTCFVSAPAGTRLDALRESLVAHGIRPLVPSDLFPGNDWATEIQDKLREADLVVGVLPSNKKTSWVLFELGQAVALGKKILLIASAKSDPIPLGIQHFLVLRTSPNNRQAIDFALDQLLSSPAAAQPTSTTKKSYESLGLGARSDEFLNRLTAILNAGDPQSLESLIADAIRNSGADVVVESPGRDRKADLAVWSDVLEPFVGNPLLIEIKLRIKDKQAVDGAVQQITSFLSAASTSWALLIYGNGPAPEDRIWKGCPPNILVIQAEALLDALRDRAFPEVIRDLRNRSVHSVRP
jgi:hypothetical protein